jgi:hypothetical protein
MQKRLKKYANLVDYIIKKRSYQHSSIEFKKNTGFENIIIYLIVNKYFC